MSLGVLWSVEYTRISTVVSLLDVALRLDCIFVRVHADTEAHE